MQSLLNIGVAGLLAAQHQLATTSHNIANVATPGYHRQTALQTTPPPIRTGYGYASQGAQVEAVMRSYNQFLENQIRNSETSLAAHSAYRGQVGMLDNIFADPETALSASIDRLFAAVHDIANEPSSVPARIAFLSSAENLVARFHSFTGQLEDVRLGVEGRIAENLADVNRYSDAIATINQQIVISESAGGGQPANDLRDQRDQQLLELNRLVKASAVLQADGQMTVYMGSGQPLVVGSTASVLTAFTAGEDPTRTQIALQAADGSRIALPEDLLGGGGSLGALMQFRRETLDFAQNRIGLLATTLAIAFNEQHAQGIDLYGGAGQPLFTVPAVYTAPGGAATVTVDHTALGALTDADYELEFDGAAYTVTNLATGARRSGLAAETTVDFEGLLITPRAGGLAAGQTAIIRPTRHAGLEIGVALRDPRGFAAALAPDAPAADDAPFSDFADNRNANRLGALQTTRLLLGHATGSATPESTLGDAYASMVSIIGSRSRSAQIGEQTQESLLKQAMATREGLSGVNLDEEAANLVRFQTAYQASARLMTVAQRLFDDLLAAMR